MNIWDLLPQDLWNGPPLPRFLNIFWPWVSGQPDSTIQTSSPLSNIFKGVTNASPTTTPPATPSTPAYENREEIEFPEGFDPDTFMPKKIVVHRRYKKKVE